MNNNRHLLRDSLLASAKKIVFFFKIKILKSLSLSSSSIWTIGVMDDVFDIICAVGARFVLIFCLIYAVVARFVLFFFF